MLFIYDWNTLDEVRKNCHKVWHHFYVWQMIVLNSYHSPLPFSPTPGLTDKKAWMLGASGKLKPCKPHPVCRDPSPAPPCSYHKSQATLLSLLSEDHFWTSLGACPFLSRKSHYVSNKLFHTLLVRVRCHQSQHSNQSKNPDGISIVCGY